VGNISFTPTFSHIDWIDEVDDVEAEGEKGVNVRFRAIEHDLQQLSTVVEQIDATIDALEAANPDPVEQRLVIPPRLSRVPSGQLWDQTATAAATAVLQNVNAGLINVLPPDGIRLLSLRVFGQVVGTTVVTTLSRIALNDAAVPEILTTVIGDTNPFNRLAPIGADVARVDLSQFRYFIRAVTSGLVGSGPVAIGAFHIGYIAD